MERLPSIPLTSGRHDRAAAKRRDDAWLTAVRGSHEARIIGVRSQSELLVAAGERLAHIGKGLPEAAELVFLGIDPDGSAVFACDLDAHELDLELAEGHEFGELRAVGGSLTPDDAALAVQAVAMVGWHRRHRFCGVCGGAAEVQEAGHSRRCTACGAQHFPRTDPAVIMIVTDGDRCVLSRRPGAPANRWTVLSGFVEPGETPEEAVIREVLEEVGLQARDAHYVGAQPWPFPASLMLGYHALADYAPLTVDDELEEARWFTRAEIKRGIEDGSFAFPVSISISRQLLLAWLAEGERPSP